MAHKDKRIDVRVYLEPDEHEYLKAVATVNGISMSELLRTCTLRKCKFSQKKKARLKLALPNTETSSLPYGGNKNKIQKRIDEIDTMFAQAKAGEIPKIPQAQYHRLKAERFELNDLLNEETDR